MFSDIISRYDSYGKYEYKELTSFLETDINLHSLMLENNTHTSSDNIIKKFIIIIKDFFRKIYMLVINKIRIILSKIPLKDMEKLHPAFDKKILIPEYIFNSDYSVSFSKIIKHWIYMFTNPSEGIKLEINTEKPEAEDIAIKIFSEVFRKKISGFNGTDLNILAYGKLKEVALRDINTKDIRTVLQQKENIISDMRTLETQMIDKLDKMKNIHIQYSTTELGNLISAFQGILMAIKLNINVEMTVIFHIETITIAHANIK